MKMLLRTAHEHIVGIIASFVIAVIVVAPLFVFPFYAGDRYAGINIHHVGTDEHLYLTRAKDVLEGKGLGQPVLNFGSELQDPTFSNIERILMAPFTLTGLSDDVDVVSIFNAYNFFGIFILMLILYALVYSLTRDKLFAAAAAMFVIGGYSIVYNKALFYSDFNIYLRSVYPYTASIPFFLYAFFVYHLKNTLHRWGLVVGAGVALAFLFHIYFYGWTFALAFSGALFLILLALKQYGYAWRIALANGIGILLATPHLINFIRYFTSEAGAQLSYFLWSSKGHDPVFSLIGFLTLLLLVGYWFVKRNDPNIPFLFAAVAAVWISLNQQIITGRFIQYGHYYWYFIVPLSIIIALYIVHSLIPDKQKKYFSVFVIGIVLLNSLVGQYQSFFTTIPDKLRDQEYAPVIRTLDTLPPGAVLTHQYGPQTLLVTILTDHDLFFGGTALVHNVPIEYIEDALLLFLHLNRDSREDPTAFLQNVVVKDASYDDFGSPYQYRGLYTDIEGYRSGFDFYAYQGLLKVNAPVLAEGREELLTRLQERYQELFSSRIAAREFLLDKGVRYVLWDQQKSPEWDLSVLEPLRTIATSTDLILYEIVESKR